MIAARRLNCMRHRTRRGIGALLLGAALAGCATTGDPSRDTIFWSRRKADERLAGERAVAADEQQRVAELSQRNQELREAGAAIEEQRTRLAREVAELSRECDRLSNVIHADDPRQADELAGLRRQVADLKAQTESIKAERSETEKTVGKAVDELEARITAASAHIRALLRASGE